MTTPEPATPGPDAQTQTAPPTPPSPSDWSTTAAPPPGANPPPPFAAAPPPGAPSGPAGTPPWPDRREPQAAGLVMGIILIVVGALFLVARLADITFGPDSWPLWLIVPGLAMLIGSLFIPPRGGLGLAVPGVMIAIVGMILWVQSVYDLYETWAYAWALVAPTGPGLAMLAYGAAQRDGDLVRDGFRTTITGLGLFVGFGIFFEGVVGISGHRVENLDQVLPYAAIGLGILLIVLALVDGGRGDRWRDERRARRQAERERRRAEKAARRAAR